jgi:hypothetical protein
VVAAQLFTLAGVALGALASYVISSLGERTRHQREIAKGWEERKFDGFVTYVNDIKAMSTIAKRMTAFSGLHVRSADKLDPAVGAPLLAEADSRRSVSMERMRLLSGVDTITAASRLDSAVWNLEWIARGLIDGAAPKDWQAAQHEFEAAFDAFHECARRELGVPGQLGVRRVDPLPALETLRAISGVEQPSARAPRQWP